MQKQPLILFYVYYAAILTQLCKPVLFLCRLLVTVALVQLDQALLKYLI